MNRSSHSTHNNKKVVRHLIVDTLAQLWMLCDIITTSTAPHRPHLYSIRPHISYYTFQKIVFYFLIRVYVVRRFVLFLFLFLSCYALFRSSFCWCCCLCVVFERRFDDRHQFSQQKRNNLYTARTHSHSSSHSELLLAAKTHGLRALHYVSGIII